MEKLCEPCGREGKQSSATSHCLDCKELYCNTCGGKHVTYKICLTHIIKPVEDRYKKAEVDRATKVKANAYIDMHLVAPTQNPTQSPSKMTGIVYENMDQQGKMITEKAELTSEDTADYLSPYYKKQEDSIYEEVSEVPDDPRIASIENSYDVTLTESPLPRKHLSGSYRLDIMLEGIKLLDHSTGAEKLYWPLVGIRRTGYASRHNEFHIEAGRACGRGCGMFRFNTQSAKDIHENIQNLYKVKKDLMKK